MVTPQNFRMFMKAHKRWSALRKGERPHWHFQELYSCSGRLSLTALNAGLRCGFPVDFRYGWDLRRKDHRAMIDEAHAFFTPDVEYMAPDCRLWSAARRKVDAAREQVEGQLELPALQWLAVLGMRQSAAGRAFIAENPLKGEISKLTPLSKLFKIQNIALPMLFQ